MWQKSLSTIIILILSILQLSAQNKSSELSGQIIADGEPIDYAIIRILETNQGTSSSENGKFKFKLPTGTYTISVSAIGYEPYKKKVVIVDNQNVNLDINLNYNDQSLEEVVIETNAISRLSNSAYNAIAIDTKAKQNSNQNIGDALKQVPGIKLRETGGVGSDMQLMMDGFSGKHIKIFIDGVPQEGVGGSFGLNNIPVNFAERIEVYKGVVPVGFGTDAIGGVINIVTPKRNIKQSYIDASYSFGSFNTHKSYANFGQTLDNGFTYEVNAFQNYSDNNYKIYTPVKDFESGVIDKSKKEWVKRFNDKYHNEAITAKIGVVNKKWADRLLFGFKYSHQHKEIQNGVRQDIVYGEKFNYGHSIMPSLEYSKNDIAKNLDFNFTANYNKNIVNNVDTTNFEYNWYGHSRPSNAPGEQSYQLSRSTNHNFNSTVTSVYRLGIAHSFTVNNVYNHFTRNNQSLLVGGSKNPIDKRTEKNISGLSYRYIHNQAWNLSVFSKIYNQKVSGPMASTANQDEFERVKRSIGALGYGLATTYFVNRQIQAKLSMERAYRLPTIDELFGDEDLESGDIKIKPEKSDNYNFSISYNTQLGTQSLYVEAGYILRNTNDYIQRKIQSLSGGKFGAAFENHGHVVTNGFNIAVHYVPLNWISLGANFTETNARDKVKTIGSTSTQANPTYGARMPNTPYRFANSDITFYWRNSIKKGNLFTATYDNLHLHGFPLYSEVLGSSSEFLVPSQFSHNLTLSYAMNDSKYNFSVELRNFSNEKLYDNFSLQKAGRAFYAKARIYFHSNK